MRTKIFINLPVADPTRSLAFYRALGYTHNPQLCGADGVCILLSEEIHVMAMTHAMFKEIIPPAISVTTKSALSLSCESRQQVIDLVAKAVAAGGSIFEEAQDHGFIVRFEAAAELA